MSDRENLNVRLNYHGGLNQQTRMNADKLRSLKKALIYSYQAATALLSDGREFRCLINPNKLSLDVDNKILSIPFRDRRLNINAATPPAGDGDVESPDDGDYWEDMDDLVATLSLISLSEGSWGDMGDEDQEPELPEEPEEPGDNTPTFIGDEEINIKEGDVICWKENGSYWLVYLRRLEETAYFRAEVRRCRYELALGNGSKYWAYVRGPVEQTILWSQRENTYFNRLNNSLVMYITQNEETLKYFRRFKKVTINDVPWEVQAVDSISTPGILEIALKETYKNTIEQDIDKVIEQVTKEDTNFEQPEGSPYIQGPSVVYPYDSCRYKIIDCIGGGIWKITNLSRKNAIKVTSSTADEIQLSIMTGKSGSFRLAYELEGRQAAVLDITIGTL